MGGNEKSSRGNAGHHISHRDCYISAKGNKELTRRPYRHTPFKFKKRRSTPLQHSTQVKTLINLIQDVSNFCQSTRRYTTEDSDLKIKLH